MVIALAAEMPRSIAIAIVGLIGCGPQLVERPVTARTYAAGPDATCGQDLASTTFVATGARWGETLHLQGCAAYGLHAYVEVSATQVEPGPRRRTTTLGHAADRRPGRCGDPEWAGPASDGHGGGQAPGRGGDASGDPVGAATTVHSALFEIADAGEVCRSSSSTTMSLGQLEAGTPITVRVWTRSPHDLAGALVRIIHVVDEPNVSDAEWIAHRRAEAARHSNQAPEHSAPGRPAARPSDEPSRPPPPPRTESRPPAPSASAEWIPGYWHWERDWFWVSGRWQVREGASFVSAPYAPPPPREERAPRVTGSLVWTPGFWAWDGRSYVWVAGGWGRPPRAGLVWRPARWRASAGRVTFVPGGWATP